MATGTSRHHGRDGPGSVGPSGGQLNRFLRTGHVLRSLLREFLEEDFLSQLCPHRLTSAQFCFLKLIAAKPDLRVGQLARYLGVSPATSSKNLDTLVELGLVVREVWEADRRAVVLKASPEGTELVRGYERLKADRLMPVIDQLGQQKTSQLCDLLEEVCVGALTRSGTDRGICLRCAGYYRAGCVFEDLHGECAMKPRRDRGPAGVEVDASDQSVAERSEGASS
jgi:DNA-binding MarR family transcriptional regulator